jgi:hypothetical protein
MSNLITRRLALFRIASAGTAAAVAAAPVAIAAVQPKTSETPELIQLGQHLVATAQECLRLRPVKDDARVMVMASWPSCPEEISAGRCSNQAEAENETNCDGEPLNRGRPYNFSVYKHYHSAENISARLAELPVRGGTSREKRERQVLKRLLPISTEYANAKAKAIDAHDYSAKVRAYNHADWDVTQTLHLIAALPALTPDGITIKAQAYQACKSLGKEGALQASLHLGPSIADDICRVLSEGDEA